MARIVLLNGPAGVGKTTVGRALATLVPNGACVHGDCLKHVVVARVDGAVSGGLGYVNGATVAANFIDAGYDLVVFEYVFEHPSHIDRFGPDHMTLVRGGARTFPTDQVSVLRNAMN